MIYFRKMSRNHGLQLLQSLDLIMFKVRILVVFVFLKDLLKVSKLHLVRDETVVKVVGLLLMLM